MNILGLSFEANGVFRVCLILQILYGFFCMLGPLISYTPPGLRKHLNDVLTLWLFASPVITALCWVGYLVAKKFFKAQDWLVYIPPFLLLGGVVLTIAFYYAPAPPRAP